MYLHLESRRCHGFPASPFLRPNHPSATFISHINSINGSCSISDPITAALLPPPNESVTDREKRLRAEEQAKKISDEIDKMLQAERDEARKKNPLGQSESGKSTTLERMSMPVFSTSTLSTQPNPSQLSQEFQLLHTPAAFHRNAPPGVSSSISTSFVPFEESPTPFLPVTRPSTPTSWTTRTTRIPRLPP